MTTITIDEDVKIDTHFRTFFDFISYIDKVVNIEITELNNQERILKSNEYKEYNKVLENV